MTVEELARTRERMDLYDGLSPKVRALAREHGIARVLFAMEQGVPDHLLEAALEDMRELLQVQRWENTT